MEASEQSQAGISDSPETVRPNLRVVTDSHTPQEHADFLNWLHEHREKVRDERLFARFMERQQTYEWLWENDKTSPIVLQEIIEKLVSDDEDAGKHLTPDEVGILYVGALDVAQAKLEIAEAKYIHLEHPATRVRTQVVRSLTTDEVEQMGYTDPTVESIRESDGTETELHTLRLYKPQYTISGERRELAGITESNSVQLYRDGQSVSHTRTNTTNELSPEDLASFVELMVSSKIVRASDDEFHGEEPPPLSDSNANEA